MKRRTLLFSSFGLLLLAAVTARAEYPAAIVPTTPPPPVELQFDPKTLPDKPGCSVVKAEIVIDQKHAPLNFQLYLPPGFPKPVGFQSGLVPVVVSLHNRSTIGNDDGSVLGESLPSLLAAQDWDNRFSGEKPEHLVPLHKLAPMICIAPHCPGGFSWESPGMAQAVGLLIDAVVTGLHADPDHVSLTGFSYGASSTWVIAQQIPDRFASVVVCDGRRTDNAAATAAKLKHVAVYLTAGDQDGDFTNDARVMSAGFGAAGHPNFVYREWRDGNHFCYCATYSDPIFWAWLQGQKRAPAEFRQPSRPADAILAKSSSNKTAPQISAATISGDLWPTRPGYFSFHGRVKVGDEEHSLAMSVFLPKVFAKIPANLPVVVSLQNDTGDDGEQSQEGLSRLLHKVPPKPDKANNISGIDLSNEAGFIGLIVYPPPGVDWNSQGVPEMLNDLLDQMVRHYKADGHRVTLTAVGAQCKPAWSIAAALHDRFTAVAVLGAEPIQLPPSLVAPLQHAGLYVELGTAKPETLADETKLRAALSTLPHRDFVVQRSSDADRRAGAESVYRSAGFWQWVLSHRQK